MIMKKTVGEKIRSFRQQKKLTQEQLALGAEINPVFLGHLERNLKSPTITTLEKITRALGITMSELLLDVPNNDSEIEVRQASMQHINYLLKDLSNEELDKITGILKEIIDWKKNVMTFLSTYNFYYRYFLYYVKNKCKKYISG